MRISQVFGEFGQEIAENPLTTQPFLRYCLMNHPDATVFKPDCT